MRDEVNRLSKRILTTHVGSLPRPVELLDRMKAKLTGQPVDDVAYEASIARVKGNVTDKKAFEAALKEGTTKSTRGTLKFNSNHFPINDWHVFEAAKDAKGRVSLKTIATPLKDHKDAYHTQCAMK